MSDCSYCVAEDGWLRTHVTLRKAGGCVLLCRVLSTRRDQRIRQFFCTMHCALAVCKKVAIEITPKSSETCALHFRTYRYNGHVQTNKNTKCRMISGEEIQSKYNYHALSQACCSMWYSILYTQKPPMVNSKTALARCRN